MSAFAILTSNPDGFDATGFTITESDTLPELIRDDAYVICPCFVQQAVRQDENGGEKTVYTSILARIRYTSGKPLDYAGFIRDHWAQLRHFFYGPYECQLARLYDGTNHRHDGAVKAAFPKPEGGVSPSWYATKDFISAVSALVPDAEQGAVASTAAALCYSVQVPSEEINLADSRVALFLTGLGLTVSAVVAKINEIRGA